MNGWVNEGINKLIVSVSNEHTMTKSTKDSRRANSYCVHKNAECGKFRFIFSTREGLCWFFRNWAPTSAHSFGGKPSPLYVYLVI